MKNYNLTIEHQCPQCGAPATLEETDRLFSCNFCRVRSYLAVRDFFRFRLPDRAPEGTSLFFIPYWRFKGMVFSSGFQGIRHDFLDVSAPAVDLPAFPPSLGFRSQALKLKFVSPDAAGHFVTPRRMLDEAMEKIFRRLDVKLSAPVCHRSRIGESVSLIYAPFYLKKGLYDAVLNTPVPGALSEDVDAAALPGGRPRWRIRFLACLCPDCGWDMEGRRDSLVLHCPNCETAWQAAGNGFKKIRVEHFPESRKADTFLPFWRIRADVEGMRLAAYADLVRAANLPKVIRKKWDAVPAYFWTPAFKIRPARFLRFTAHMTLTAPMDPAIPRIPKGNAFPVTLSVKEAAEALMPGLISFVRPQREFLERIDAVRIRPKSYRLVYLPFGESRHEWIQKRYALVINKSTLGHAKNL